MPTDADAVHVDSGKPSQKAVRRASPAALRALPFAAGSMGPKVEAACRFVAATGKRAAIGELASLSRIIAGEAGTTVAPDVSGIAFATNRSQRERRSSPCPRSQCDWAPPGTPNPRGAGRVGPALGAQKLIASPIEVPLASGPNL
jgi:hypothetical protein